MVELDEQAPSPLIVAMGRLAVGVRVERPVVDYIAPSDNLPPQALKAVSEPLMAI